jgi:hypothetical protein
MSLAQAQRYRRLHRSSLFTDLLDDVFNKRCFLYLYKLNFSKMFFTDLVLMWLDHLPQNIVYIAKIRSVLTERAPKIEVLEVLAVPVDYL